MAFYFGILTDLSIEVSTLALVLTVFFLAFFEVLTKSMEFIVRSSRIYNQMLQKMYKELMTMGFVTLATALYTAADQSSVFAQHSTEIDFVGYITFFVALFFVAHGLYIMLLSIRTGGWYGRLHRIKIPAALDMYVKSQKNFFQRILFRVSFAPLSSVRQVLEFKIIHSLFRDTYWLPNDFDFGLYLSHSFQKYSLRIINIGFTTWIILIVLGLINFVRVKFMPSESWLQCGHNHAHSHDETPHECVLFTLHLFLFSGGLVVLYALILFLTGRVYLSRLLSSTGIENTDDYTKFLMFEESISLKASAQAQRKKEITIEDTPINKRQSRRMSISTLRNNIDELMKQPQVEERMEALKKISTSSRTLSRQKSLLHGILKKVKSSGPLPFLKAKSLSWSSRVRAIKKVPLVMQQSPTDDSETKKKPIIYRKDSSGDSQGSKKNGVLRSLRKSLTPPQQDDKRARRQNIVFSMRNNSLPSDDDTEDAEQVEQLTATEQFKLFKLKEGSSSSSVHSTLMLSLLKQQSENKFSNKPLDGGQTMKLTEDLSGIYLFHSPQLYFKAVEYAIMLNSLYLSFWGCNFITVVHDNLEAPWTHIYQVTMLVPLVIVLPLLGEIVKVSSLLAAIAALDIDVIGTVLEDMEEQGGLVAELRGKVLRRIVGSEEDKRLIVQQLFREIDINGDGKVSRQELRQMLRALSLHYSDAKFHRLFNVLDEDLSGYINESELTSLLFPGMLEKDNFQLRRHLLKEKKQELQGKKPSRAFNAVMRKCTRVSPYHHSRAPGTADNGEDNSSTNLSTSTTNFLATSNNESVKNVDVPDIINKQKLEDTKLEDL